MPPRVLAFGCHPDDVEFMAGGTPTRPASRIPHLYYWDAVGLADIFGRPLPLSCAVDVSDALERKRAMLACHASQREWLRFINGWDEYLAMMQRTTEEQGRRVGRAAPEGFIQHLGNGHPRDNILKAVLGGRCMELEP